MTFQIEMTEAKDRTRAWVEAHLFSEKSISAADRELIFQALSASVDGSKIENSEVCKLLESISEKTRDTILKVHQENKRQCEIPKVEAWLSQMSEISDRSKRQQEIQAALQAEWGKGPASFYVFIKALSVAQFPFKKDRNEVRLESALELENEVYVIAVTKVSQQDEEGFEQWIDYLQQKIRENGGIPDSSFSAGVPEIQEKNQRFISWVKEAFKDDKDKYGLFLRGYKEIVKRIWGEKYEGFKTNGTAEAFKAWCNEYFADEQEARLIASDHEYIRMFPRDVYAQKTNFVPISTSDSEEVMAQKYLEAITEQDQKKDRFLA